ncbi:carbon-nitrogen hydrolase family protein [Nocardia brasiliensis]|uniref:carbon-nitrogen hydrolase family protein n=1 Tax=Nocardia brasiliensis TaxID=37326 RepID=UPI003D89D647
MGVIAPHVESMAFCSTAVRLPTDRILVIDPLRFDPFRVALLLRCSMRVTLAQCEVGRELSTNKRKIMAAIDRACDGEWILFPECALTGYFPREATFLEHFDRDAVTQAMAEICARVRARGCHCLLGTARYHEGSWFNSVAVMSRHGLTGVYDKIAISDIDKAHFAPGADLPVFELDEIVFGLQICRELVDPEPWRELRRRGARIVFHSNNAIDPNDDKWESIISTRAIDSGLFIASSNNCTEPATLTSYLVDPTGRQIAKARRRQEQLLSADISLGAS